MADSQGKMQTAGHNTRQLSSNRTQVVPAPSEDTRACEAFYNNPKISARMTAAFKANALDACIVTGNKAPMTLIRKNLQVIYSTRKPGNGKTFTFSEHKKIHDEAYRKSGCKTESAGIVGWWVVDTIPFIPRGVVGWSIDTFGQCKLDAPK